MSTRTESMKNLIAKLRETLHNPQTRDEMLMHMQALLYDAPLATDEMELERPLSGTSNSLSSRQEEKDDGIPMMHASLDDIKCDMAHAKLFKEKTMSLDCDTAFATLP